MFSTLFLLLREYNKQISKLFPNDYKSSPGFNNTELEEKKWQI